MCCISLPINANSCAKLGRGRSLAIRADEQFQDKLRAKLKTKRGRAALRTRTAVEHAISHHLMHRGRRARYKGLRKNQFDGRRHAAVSNLQVAARYAEERRLAS
jgi:Transposase DDE domain